GSAVRRGVPTPPAGSERLAVRPARAGCDPRSGEVGMMTRLLHHLARPWWVRRWRAGASTRRRGAVPRLSLLEDRGLPSLTPHLLADLNQLGAGSDPGPFVTIGAITLFAANDGVHGRELWRTDGTEEGTVLVKDISPGPENSNPTSLTNVNGTLFFA